MGYVLTFRSGETRARRRAAAIDGASAEILFFTGVRYEPRSGAATLRSQAFAGEKAPPASPPPAHPHQGV